MYPGVYPGGALGPLPRARPLELRERAALSGAAGWLGALVGAPFDRLKSRAIAGVGALPASSGGVAGMRTLYRGLGPMLAGALPEKTLKLLVQGALVEQATRSSSGGGLPAWAVEAAAGGVAGGVQALAKAPFEATSLQMQLSGGAGGAAGGSAGRNSGAAAAAAGAPRAPAAGGALRLAAELGPRGLYRGAGVMALRDAGFNALFFSLFAEAKRSELKRSGEGMLPAWKLAALGMAASIPPVVLTHPIEVLKTRVMAARGGESVWAAARAVLAERGLAGFSRGLAHRCLAVAPLFGVALSSFEVLQRICLPQTVGAAEVTQQQRPDDRGVDDEAFDLDAMGAPPLTVAAPSAAR